ncbi:Lrp/AsnC family transcriptional regulator [Sphingosinicella rhizophila]|uniref:Lrp/AsnC family transcriptional regulator n=1 Tax=Sphingosinicella rhizophila TaxID=3050082 RepID=A0ABU3Q690_9SPHN|nr:Lrp/AsnC family transcriptional regulator [Sphingosinicella sp. GR2756]MDT9598483.1 Lrp/AsnC family transcriptional regulator [Sphingosinicella sp. GR2756]
MSARISKKPSDSGLDAADRRILRELQKNGRITVAELSSKVGLSATPCWRRIRDMEKNDVIQGYSCRVNPSAVGFEIEAMIQVSLEKHADTQIVDFVSEVKKIPNVLKAYSVAGSYDALLHVAAASIPDLEQVILVKVAKLPSVAHLHSALILKQFVDGDNLPL